MGDRSSVLLRRRLVDHLRRQGLVHDPRVEQAFLDVPREVFVPGTLAREGLVAVYRDDAIVTRRDPETRAALSSSSQPAIMAIMLEMLRVQPGQRVLEIGTGTGYNAALLDHLAGPGGVVVSIDLDAGTVLAAADALRSLGLRVRLVVADGALGLPGLRRPGTAVDGIMVTASTSVVPRCWYEQLAERGRLVVPLRLSDELERAHAVSALVKVPGGFDAVDVTPGGFMPLRRHDGSTLGARQPNTGGPEPIDPERPVDGGGSSPLARVTRDEMDRLVIRVRYTAYAAERPAGRWLFDRGDHQIAVDIR